MAEATRNSDLHFAIGLTATVKPGAKPAGWPDYELFAENAPVNRQIEEVSASEDGYPYGTYMVGGWNWDPKDVIVQ